MSNYAKVLVTGGAGFIGSHLVDALMSKACGTVKVVDNLSSGSIDNIKQYIGNPSFEFINGDLKDPEVAVKSVDDVEVVYHLAANPDVRLGVVDPSVHFNENLLVTFNLLEAMRKSGKAKLIVFASTSAVYGEPDIFPTPESYGPLLPISVYGAAKLGGEALIAAYCHTFCLSGVLLRFANIVGSRSNHGVILDFIRKIKENPAELEILGDGTQKKSYLYVEDLIRAFFVVLDGFENGGQVEVFNVGSLDQVSVTRIAEIICEEIHIDKPKFRFKNDLKDGRGWKGDVKTMSLSIANLLDFGWRVVHNSEEAVRISCRELLQSA